MTKRRINSYAQQNDNSWEKETFDDVSALIFFRNINIEAAESFTEISKNGFTDWFTDSGYSMGASYAGSYVSLIHI